MPVTANNLTSLIVVVVLLVPQAASSIPRDPLSKLDEFDVMFTSLSRDEADSIPVGDGAAGINLWVEQNGDVLFYISSNDALSEMHRLFKFGRVRVSLRANPFVAGNPYKQTLHLRNGRCDIAAGSVRLKVFVDARGPTIYVVAESQQPVRVTATLENWRRPRPGARDCKRRDPFDTHLSRRSAERRPDRESGSRRRGPESSQRAALVSSQCAHAGAAALETPRTSVAGWRGGGHHQEPYARGKNLRRWIRCKRPKDFAARKTGAAF